VERVTGLVPVRVVFASHNVQEVALRKTEVARLWIGVGRRVVVEGFYNLLASKKRVVSVSLPPDSAAGYLLVRRQGEL
jgi:hypothetical protein